ncbi:glycosyl hydrolases family 31 protein [Glomus cerebriforme]|uniref:alpha-glucosidase n=1 Tax=Glomus cerebriforme TaxID=658196 RepID=A0A397SPD7_9GLOM|nr:glycosyl hydrolases family 31 protein [Glomus cerebriforme]
MIFVLFIALNVFSAFLLLPWIWIPWNHEKNPLLTLKNDNLINDSIDICSISDVKYDCGYFGITKEQCEARFCCWRPSENPEDKWCFYKRGDSYSCNIDPATRVDCGYLGIQKDECVNKLNCCWNPTDVIGGNYCYYKTQPCKGYKVVNTKKRNNDRVLIADLELNGIGCGLYGHDSKHLKLLVEYETEDRLHVKIYDPKERRFEIPEEIVPVSGLESITDDILYNFLYNENQFTFSVARADTGEKIIDTDVPGMNTLIFEDQYMEISFKLPQDPFIYGLGEVVDTFRRNPRGTFQTIWNRDAATPVAENGYGAQPFYLEMRNGTAHGVFLRNSNGMDVTITPGNVAKLNWKVIGGIFDFYIFLGPTPSDVIAQYTKVVGRPSLPPYWALGYHQCRWGYNNVKALEKVVSEFKSQNIPLETIWTDIDYMQDFKDFTWDSENFSRHEIGNFVKKLHENEQHYVVIVDPGIKIEAGYYPYEDGINKNVFIKNSKGENIVGRVWPGLTVFPDWFNENIIYYWGDLYEKWLKNVAVDGIWIDMNEVSSWCRGECVIDEKANVIQQNINDQNITINTRHHDLNNPPYKINNGGVRLPLDEKTLSMDAVHSNGFLEYDVHNLYGHMESMITYNILSKRIRKGKRPFIITRSSFAGTGKYAGHWTGDNWSNWDHLYFSIPGLLNFQLFGIPLVGADICGFVGRTTEELCLRWMQLGSFYPFMRNHNGLLEPSQEPYLWPSVAKISRKFLKIRYSLLSYYYTLFYESNLKGLTVWRPLFFEFPSSKHTYIIDKQFMIGSGLLLSPVLYKKTNNIKALIPPGLWYDFYEEKLSFNITNLNGKFVDLYAPLEVLPIFIRGGFILPMQYPELTTAATKRNNYYLMIALDENEYAKGTLYLDDGESIDVGKNFTYLTFMVNNNTLTSQCDLDLYKKGFEKGKEKDTNINNNDLYNECENNYNLITKLDKIIIMGILKNQPIIKKILLNDNEIFHHHHKWIINNNFKKLILSNLDLNLNQSWNLTWEF